MLDQCARYQWVCLNCGASDFVERHDGEILWDKLMEAHSAKSPQCQKEKKWLIEHTRVDGYCAVSHEAEAGQ